MEIKSMQLTKKTFYLGLAAASSLLAGSAVMAADGAALYTAKMCQTCHGPDANTPTVSTYPKLGGQNESYLLAQIKDIRDGKRTNGQTAAMKAMMDAMKVSDDEAAAVAKWIASQPAKSNK
jgi:cytochrome c